MEAMAARLEEMHRRDLKLVQTEVQQLTDRLKKGETSLASLENRVIHLEQVQILQASHASSLQLHLEELEDHNRRHNLRFRGIPEAIGRETLQSTVLAICQQLATSAPSHNLELKRLGRSLGPHSVKFM